MKRVIEILKYSHKWPEQFEEEKRRLSSIFNSLKIEIHHIGSTAVPGLSAKPIIDLLIEVKDIKKVDTYNQKMEQLGYEAKGENGIKGRRYFQKGGNERTHHVHIYEKGHPEINRHIWFRDYLRTHPDAAKEYETLKTELAHRYRFEPEKYVENKTNFIHKIDGLALKWRKGSSNKNRKDDLR
ncbi:GrpB family protein [Priestia megaterium]